MPSTSKKRKSSKKNKARRAHPKAYATPSSPGNGKLKSIVEKNRECGCRSSSYDGSDGGEFFTPVSQFHPNPSFCKAELGEGEEEGGETVKSSELYSKRADEGLLELEVVEKALEREESWESHEVNFEYIGLAKNSTGVGSLGDDEGTSFSNVVNEIRKEGNYVSLKETTSLEDSVKLDDASVKKELNAVIEAAPTGCNAVAEERKNAPSLNSFDPVHPFPQGVGCGTATAIKELVFPSEVDLGLKEERKAAPIVNSLEETQSPEEVDCGTAAAPIDELVVSGVKSLGLKENDQLLTSFEEVPGVSTTNIDLPVKKKEGKEGKVFPFPNGHGCASSKGMDFEPKVNGDVFPVPADYGCASTKRMDFQPKVNGDVFPVADDHGCASSKGINIAPATNGDKSYLPSDSLRSEGIPDCSENQPLIASPQPAKTTSWKSCCGLFDLLTGSNK